MTDDEIVARLKALAEDVKTDSPAIASILFGTAAFSLAGRIEDLHMLVYMYGQLLRADLEKDIAQNMVKIDRQMKASWLNDALRG